MSTQASSTMADSDAEQLTMLRESAMDVVQRGANMKHLRERRGTLPGYDPAYLRQMAELGWLGLLVPEAHGGLGLGLTEMAALLQELGKGLMADPLPAVALATRVLVHCPQWAAAGGHLAALARGEALPAVAWQEGLGGIDPASSRAWASRRTRARRCCRTCPPSRSPACPRWWRTRGTA